MCPEISLEMARGRSRALLRAGRARRSWCIALLGFVIALSGLDPVAADDYTDEGQPLLPTVTLQIGDASLLTELATSPDQRYRGLGNRRTLADAAAMLFVYPAERMLTFTMRDTRMALSIAYLSDAPPATDTRAESDAMPANGDRSGKLVINEIIDMDVGPNQLFPSTRAARYALEVNQGWFEKHGIKAGDVVGVALR